MLISKRSFLNLTRSKIGIIRIWEKRRAEGVEKSASRIIRAARFFLIKFGFKFPVGSSVPVILISMAGTKEDKRRMSDLMKQILYIVLIF